MAVFERGDIVSIPLDPTVGHEQRAAVAGEVLCVVWRSKDWRVFEKVVGLQRAVKHRHRDGRVTAPEQAVSPACDGIHHAVFPQRLSYCT